MSYTNINKLNQVISGIVREDPSSETVGCITQAMTGIRNFYELTEQELLGIKNVGPQKAKAILSAIELSRFISSSKIMPDIAISGPKSVADYLTEDMRYLDREHFVVLMLNTKGRIICKETVSIGDLSSTIVHPREVFKGAVKHSAAAIIAVHNHPSGNSDPSQEDINITNRLVEAGKILGIKVLDHIVIGDGTYSSFKDSNLI